MAVAVTVDFDAHSGWIGGYELTTPSVLSRGEFGAEEGIPRLLDLFRRLAIPTTWCTPGHDLVTFPAQVEAVLNGGHEIAAHGCYHENILKLAPGRERELMELQLAQHKQIVGKLPRGYRSPSWDFSEVTMSILEEFGFDWDSSLMGREFEPYHPRPVEVHYESASLFGPPSPLLEIPVSWYLDDWPAVEYVPRSQPHLGDWRAMHARWREIFDYAYERVPNAVYTLTIHPQTSGRSHHLAGLETFLSSIRERPDVWWCTLSDVYDAWSDEHVPE